MNRVEILRTFNLGKGESTLTLLSVLLRLNISRMNVAQRVAKGNAMEPVRPTLLVHKVGRAHRLLGLFRSIEALSPSRKVKISVTPSHPHVIRGQGRHFLQVTQVREVKNQPFTRLLAHHAQVHFLQLAQVFFLHLAQPVRFTDEEVAQLKLRLVGRQLKPTESHPLRLTVNRIIHAHGRSQRNRGTERREKHNPL